MRCYKVLAAGLTIALAGCTHTVVRDCATPEQIQQLRDAEPPKVSDKLTGKADEDVRIIGGSAIRLRAWGRGAIETLEGCSGPA